MDRAHQEEQEDKFLGFVQTLKNYIGKMEDRLREDVAEVKEEVGGKVGALEKQVRIEVA